MTVRPILLNEATADTGCALQTATHASRRAGMPGRTVAPRRGRRA